MHTNLFRFGHTRAEVLDGINADHKRDSGTLRIIDLVMFGSVLVLVRNMDRVDAIATFVAVFTAITGLRYFIDLSNRNFYLHRLDWESAGTKDQR